MQRVHALPLNYFSTDGIEQFDLWDGHSIKKRGPNFPKLENDSMLTQMLGHHDVEEMCQQYLLECRYPFDPAPKGVPVGIGIQPNALELTMAKIEHTMKIIMYAMHIVRRSKTGYTWVLGWIEAENPRIDHLANLNTEVYLSGENVIEEIRNDVWTMPELEELKTLSKRIHDLFKKAPSNNGYHRMTRAIAFFELACCTYNLDISFVNFMIALESLFNTDRMEVGYKMRSRVSYFLEQDDPNKRLDLANTIKRLYGFRSDIVHGEGVAKYDEKTAKEYIHQIESVVRDVLKKILNSDDFMELFCLNKDKRGTVLDAVVFGLSLNRWKSTLKTKGELGPMTEGQVVRKASK